MKKMFLKLVLAIVAMGIMILSLNIPFSFSKIFDRCNNAHGLPLAFWPANDVRMGKYCNFSSSDKFLESGVGLMIDLLFWNFILNFFAFRKGGWKSALFASIVVMLMILAVIAAWFSFMLHNLHL